MSCNLLTSDIVNSCTSVRGLNPKAWIFPFVGTKVFFEELEDSQRQTYKTVQLIGSANQLGPSVFEAFKYGLNAGSDVVVSEVRKNVFSHYFSGVLQPSSVATQEALDKMDGVIVVVLTNEGKYLVYGAENGLWKSSQTKRANDNTALHTVEFASREGLEESQSEYVLNAGSWGNDEFLNNTSYIEGFMTDGPKDATSDVPFQFRISTVGSHEVSGDWFTTESSVLTIFDNQAYQIFYKTDPGLIIS